MGGLKTSGHSSLDRLKGLDGLPTIGAQLDEASHLCTHGARAEMILKWLLDKLKKSSEARAHHRSWDLLYQSINFLSPQRIAQIFTSHSLVNSLHAACTEQTIAKATLSAIARLLGYILGLGETAHGVHVRAALSVDGDMAASICGAWLRHIWNHYKDVNGAPVTDEALAEPVLQLWDLRKHNEGDDERFCEQCLVPTMLVLTLPELELPRESKKRKRGDLDTKPEQKVVRLLETLVARHVILPARATFYHQVGGAVPLSDPSRINLDSTLNAIRNNLSSAAVSDVLNVLNRVFSIALRSISTPTPRHRSKERPWVEALFSGLRSCLGTKHWSTINRLQRQMLGLLASSGLTLSVETLANVVQDHALSTAQAGRTNDWELVARVVETEPSVFTEKDLARMVFDALSAEQKVRAGDDYAGSNAMTTTQQWKEHILAPITRAFSRNRDLQGLEEIWYQQLLQGSGTCANSVWTEMIPIFADLLESSLTDDQIMVMLDRHCAQLAAASATACDDGENLSGSQSSFIILTALLSGAHRESLVDRLQPSLESLLHEIGRLVESGTVEAMQALGAQVWLLFDRTFKLWFPTWAKGSANRDVVAARGESLLSSAFFEKALAAATAKQPRLAAAQDNSADLYSALSCVVALCSVFIDGYGDQCSKLCVQAMEAITQRTGFAALAPVLEHSEPASALQLVFLERVLPDKFRSFVEQSARDGVADVEDALRAMVSVSQMYQGDISTPGPVDLTIDLLESHRATSSGLSSEDLALSTLLNVPTTTLTSQQRGRILETLLQSATAPVGTLQQRLALMIHVLGSPRSTDKITDIPSKLWAFASSHLHALDGDSHSQQSETRELLKAVIYRVLEVWLNAQDPAQKVKSLSDLSEVAKVEIDDGLVIKGSTDAVLLDIMLSKLSALLVLTEKKSPADLCATLPHRNPKTIQKYIKVLSRAVISTLESATGSSDQYDKLCWPALEALVAMPESLLALGEVKHQEKFTRVAVQLLRNRVPEERSVSYDAVEQGMRTETHMLVQLFQIVCRFASEPSEILVSSALNVMARVTTPKQDNIILSAFALRFSKVNDESKSIMVRSLMSESQQDSTSRHEILRTAIKVMIKEDFDSSVELSGGQALRYIVTSLAKSQSLHDCHTLLQTILTILQEKPFLVNQHGVEHTLACMHSLLKSHASVQALYLDICYIITTLLTRHRSRLQGRYHLMVTIFQALVAQLFNRSKTTTSINEVSARHARALARLLELFCRPPRLPTKSNSSNLVDEIRKAQAQAGQYVQYILHHYCAQILKGSLGEGVREALQPGLWSVIEAIEVNNVDGIKSLSAAMNNSERAVLRSVYDDWKRFGKWEGL